MGERRREGTLLATDLGNYPVLLPESKCDPIEIIANWKCHWTIQNLSRCGLAAAVLKPDI